MTSARKVHAGSPRRRVLGPRLHRLRRRGRRCSRSTRRSSAISPICFAWLGLALFIDGVDGTLARFAKVSETAATIDGAILDLVVDFLTYVLVPVVALWRSDLMPSTVAFWIGLVVVIASALYFADTRMKTNDYWFRGFPAIWNVFAFYLFVLRWPWPVNAALTLAAIGGDVRAGGLRPSAAGAPPAAATIAATVVWFALPPSRSSRGCSRSSG